MTQEQNQEETTELKSALDKSSDGLNWTKESETVAPKAPDLPEVDSPTQLPDEAEPTDYVPHYVAIHQTMAQKGKKGPVGFSPVGEDADDDLDVLVDRSVRWLADHFHPFYQVMILLKNPVGMYRMHMQIMPNIAEQRIDVLLTQRQHISSYNIKHADTNTDAQTNEAENGN